MPTDSTRQPSDRDLCDSHAGLVEVKTSCSETAEQNAQQSGGRLRLVRIRFAGHRVTSVRCGRVDKAEARLRITLTLRVSLRLTVTGLRISRLGVALLLTVILASLRRSGGVALRRSRVGIRSLICRRTVDGTVRRGLGRPRVVRRRIVGRRIVLGGVAFLRRVRRRGLIRGGIRIGSGERCSRFGSGRRRVDGVVSPARAVPDSRIRVPAWTGAGGLRRRSLFRWRRGFRQRRIRRRVVVERRPELGWNRRLRS